MERRGSRLSRRAVRGGRGWARAGGGVWAAAVAGAAAAEGRRGSAICVGAPRGRLRPRGRPSGKGCASSATSRARTSSSSTATPRASRSAARLAAELVRLAGGRHRGRRATQPIRAAKQATEHDPDRHGRHGRSGGDRARRQPRAAGRQRHGADATHAPQLSGKRLELLKEAVPGLSRVAVALGSGATRPRARARGDWRRRPGAWGCSCSRWRCDGPDDFEGAFEAAAARAGRGALVFAGYRHAISTARRIVDLAAQHRLPAMYALARVRGRRRADGLWAEHC